MSRVQFTPEEALALVALATELGRNQALPFYDAAYDAALKVERSLPAEVQQGVRRVARAISIRPTRPGHLAGKAHTYQQLVAAIENRRIVQIRYESLTEWESIVTKLRPYRLLFRQHSWYVIGRSALHREIRIFNLRAHRIDRRAQTTIRNSRWFRFRPALGQCLAFDARGRPR